MSVGGKSPAVKLPCCVLCPSASRTASYDPLATSNTLGRSVLSGMRQWDLRAAEDCPSKEKEILRIPSSERLTRIYEKFIEREGARQPVKKPQTTVQDSFRFMIGHRVWVLHTARLKLDEAPRMMTG
eukprot:2285564-Rhodomonas_salina.5